MSLNILNTREYHRIIVEGSSEGNQSSPKMGSSSMKRKRSQEGLGSFLQDGAGRRRSHQAGSVDDMELCAKRMKCLYLQDSRRPKMNEVHASDIDDGYEADCEN